MSSQDMGMQLLELPRHVAGVVASVLRTTVFAHSGLTPVMLVRTVAASAISALILWNHCGTCTAAMPRVATLKWPPSAVFNFASSSVYWPSAASG
jgi:hypothetical protein